jgi:ubiquitin carboxyl-terminal hydrolase 31
VILTVVYLDQSPRQVRIGLTLPVDSDVHDLRDSLARDTGIHNEQILITEIDDVMFKRTFNDGQSIGMLEYSLTEFGIM